MRSGRLWRRTWRCCPKMPASDGTSCGRCSTRCAGSFERERPGACCRMSCRPGRWSTSRPSAGSPQAASKRWCTTCALSCAWSAGVPRSPRRWCWMAARSSPRLKVATGLAILGLVSVLQDLVCPRMPGGRQLGHLEQSRNEPAIGVIGTCHQRGGQAVLWAIDD